MHIQALYTRGGHEGTHTTSHSGQTGTAQTVHSPCAKYSQKRGTQMNANHPAEVIIITLFVCNIDQQGGLTRGWPVLSQFIWRRLSRSLIP